MHRLSVGGNGREGKGRENNRVREGEREWEKGKKEGRNKGRKKENSLYSLHSLTARVFLDKEANELSTI